MKNLTYITIIFLVLITCAFSTTSFGQKNISPEKKILIQEINELTGIHNLRASVETNSSNVSFEYCESLIEKDGDLTKSQKVELTEFLDEIKLRLNNQMSEFFADEKNMSSIYFDVVFKLYDENFTESELKELIAFYRTPTGKKTFKFTAKFDERVGKNLGDALGQKLRDYLTPKINTEVEKLKKKKSRIEAKR
jgi:histone deacetylase complex regulatory component SIN3